MASMRELSEQILGQTILNKETKDYVMTPRGPVRSDAGFTPAQFANFSASMAPGAGMADAAGRFPTMPNKDVGITEALSGDYGPSLLENVSQDKFVDAFLQGLGGMGDALYAAGPIAAAVGSALKTPRALSKAFKVSGSGINDTAEPLLLNRQRLAQEYPPVGEPVQNVDKKSGKEFVSKGMSAEELALQAERQSINKEIKKGNYDPYFNVEERYYADPSKYEISGNTLTDTLPKKAETIAAKIEQFDTPEGRAALIAAFEAGNNPKARNWYAMGQLEDEFIRVLGENEGRKQFKLRFADAMAATTGGADPGSNLLMAAYGNFQRSKGLPPGSASYEMPHPIGGRYVTGNMAMYDKILNKEVGLTAKDQPKRFNFSANFLGDMNRATIDEQMTQGLTGGKFNAPPSLSYGVIESIVHDEAKKLGIKAGNLQDVAWAGFKGSEGKPMIEWVNEMIARTARITGKTQKEVLEGFIKGTMPMYGVGGAALTLTMLQSERKKESKDPT
jgi:hypothetical protein